MDDCHRTDETHGSKVQKGFTPYGGERLGNNLAPILCDSQRDAILNQPHPMLDELALGPASFAQQRKVVERGMLLNHVCQGVAELRWAYYLLLRAKSDRHDQFSRRSKCDSRVEALMGTRQKISGIRRSRCLRNFEISYRGSDAIAQFIRGSEASREMPRTPILNLCRELLLGGFSIARILNEHKNGKALSPLTKLFVCCRQAGLLDMSIGIAKQQYENLSIANRSKAG